MQELLYQLNQTLWGSGLVCLLMGMGIFCLCYGKFAPFRSLKHFRKEEHSRGRQSPFQACMTSLAAAMGTGNIVGVATALTAGGAGAVFWMWVAALTGMGLIYAENVLSAHWKREHVSGAAAYLRYGLQSPKLSGAFAVCCVAASFGMGNMTQSHAMAQTLQEAFHIPPLATGLTAALLTGAVISGGAKRIGNVTAVVIPVLSAVYLLSAVLVIWKCRANFGETMTLIFRSAFGKEAVTGGISGAAVRHAVSVGVRRGVFSNEAGLGSSGLLHSETEGTPEFLGICGMIEVIADTFICCTVTALAVLTSGASGEGSALVLTAFREGLGKLADFLLPPIIALFVLCTLIGWSFCGSAALRSLTGEKYLTLYRAAFCTAACLGAVMQLETVWTLADIANACMAYCNLPGILLLYPAYQREKAGKKLPVPEVQAVSDVQIQ